MSSLFQVEPADAERTLVYDTSHNSELVTSKVTSKDDIPRVRLANFQSISKFRRWTFDKHYCRGESLGLPTPLSS